MTQSIAISLVSTSGDLSDFLDLPYNLYRGDPAWRLAFTFRA
ncbi:hypothetical protein AB8615_06450 [Litorimonas sp. RW-G-Af-16]